MAIIGTIRERMGLILVGFVGLALVLFVLEGVLSSGRSVLFGNGNELANINGKDVTVQEFEQKVQILSDNYKAQNQTDAIDNKMTEQFREQAWGQIINELIFGKEYAALGIEVSAQELFDMVQGKNVHQQVRQAFTDPKTGMFNPANVVKFLKNLDNVDEATRTQWFNLEKGLKEERIAQKYNGLLMNSFYVTNSDAKSYNVDQNRQAKIKYALLPYTSIPDNTVKVEESDFEAYYNEHKNEFKQAESTSRIEYVTFPVSPSDLDKKEALDDITKIYEEFKNNKTEKEDSAFVKRNSDSKADIKFFKKGAGLPPSLDTTLYSAAVGYVSAPALDGDVYRVAKVLDVKSLPDSVRARHILIQPNATIDNAKLKLRADSIVKAIKGGAKFDDLAKKLSVDKGSAEKGGDLDWFEQGKMVKPFNDACFEGKKGDLKIVESQFGIHITEILDQKSFNKQIKVAQIDRKLEASNNTYQAIYGKANEFASALTNGGDFDKTITDKGLNKRTSDVRESDRAVAGIDNSREVVRWAFKAKDAELSKVFECGDNYLVAKLTQKREKGILALSYVKETIEPIVKRNKKASMLIEKLNGAATVDAAAAKAGVAVQVAENVNFASAGIAGVGRELEVAGTVAALKQGQTSKPVKGSMGVYVVQVESVIEPAPLADLNMPKMQLQMSMRQRANYELYRALREKANVQDNRIRFY